MKAVPRIVAFIAFAFVAATGQAQQHRGLNLYFADTEGGAATLIVAPTGESILIDDGNPGTRDAERIAKLAKFAGVKQIDNLIITHWHLDHYGGTGELAKLLPIKRFFDRGIPEAAQSDDPANFPTLIAAYNAASGGKSVTLNPGSLVPLKPDNRSVNFLRLMCLCARGEVKSSIENRDNLIPAEDPNPMPADPSDNAKSLGFLLSYGKFSFIDLGDLTWNIEYKLAREFNPRPVDVYQSTHHGLNISNNPILIAALQPAVAIYNNGAHKGGHPNLTRTLRSLKGLKAIYQMHKNLNPNEDVNAPTDFIANSEDEAHCKGEFIRLSVAPDSLSYTVQIGEKGKARKYMTKR